jgi:stage II sporulation protein AA (anti-sigma F factor antagonist)
MGDTELQSGRRFAVHSERSDAQYRVQVFGEIDMAVTDVVDSEMRRVEATDAETILLDLDQLEFLDASGIRLLMDLDARSRDNGDKLRIIPASSPQVQRVLELTGVTDLLPFVD